MSCQVSAFRRQKLYFVFDRFLDVDRSGSINKKDFELVVDKIAQKKGWTENDDSNKYEETLFKFLKIWETLRLHTTVIDEITREDWALLWFNENTTQTNGLRSSGRMINKSNTQDWQITCRNFVFGLYDVSDDGIIDMEKFSAVCSNFFGVSTEESQRAFERITKNGEAPLTMDYYTRLWNDYFNSDDPNSVGNFIFGKTSFPSAFTIPKIVISACRRFKSSTTDKPPTYDLKSLTPPPVFMPEWEWPPMKISSDCS